jgi:hypothetical protein
MRVVERGEIPLSFKKKKKGMERRVLKFLGSLTTF